jgi:hypothetical protein
MPRVRFEPTTPMFERMKTVHALDRASAMIGILRSLPFNEMNFPINLCNTFKRLVGLQEQSLVVMSTN